MESKQIWRVVAVKHGALANPKSDYRLLLTLKNLLPVDSQESGIRFLDNGFYQHRLEKLPTFKAFEEKKLQFVLPMRPFATLDQYKSSGGIQFENVDGEVLQSFDLFLPISPLLASLLETSVRVLLVGPNYNLTIDVANTILSQLMGRRADDLLDNHDVTREVHWSGSKLVLSLPWRYETAESWGWRREDVLSGVVLPNSPIINTSQRIEKAREPVGGESGEVVILPNPAIRTAPAYRVTPTKDAQPHGLWLVLPDSLTPDQLTHFAELAAEAAKLGIFTLCVVVSPKPQDVDLWELAQRLGIDNGDLILYSQDESRQASNLSQLLFRTGNL